MLGSLKAASGIEDNGLLIAILLAFSYFSAPAFAENWLHIDFKSQFEAVWKLIEAGIMEQQQ